MTTTTIPAKPSPEAAAASAAAPHAEEAVDAPTLIRVAALALQLGLVALVVRQLRLESWGLYSVLLCAVAAFPVHALLPRAFRLPAFSLLSLVGLVVVVKLKATLALLGIGALLVGICHLPVRWGLRVGLLVAAATGLLLLRTGTIASPLPETFWPVLGAIFMFRLALYLHALRHREAPGGFWPTLAYFAMLPNVAFPLFPVVDYKAFVRNHYDAPDFLVYERGMRWILRGVAHLALYRLVYHHMTPDPLNVQSLGQLVQFMVGTFLLYLRVSGQFHLVVGLLHLFGFNLPETHHLYYLASSFTDLWRRINLYWTSFMMKLVYYPSFFRLRKYGQDRALLVSTAVVFVATWALHAWQTFWLLGDPHFTVPDALFWGILGALVLVTTVYEKRKPRRARTRRWEPGRAVAVVGVFLGMSALWSLWGSESVAEWLGLFHAARTTTPAELLWLGLALLAGLGVAGYPWGTATLTSGTEAEPTLPAQLRAGGVRLLALGGLLLLGVPTVREALPLSLRPYAHSVGEASLSARDEALLQRGYYEQLNAASRTGGEMWDAVARRPAAWSRGLSDLGLTRSVPGVLLAELQPGLDTIYKGQRFSTNSAGLRDREYPVHRAPGTYRIAVLGPSLVMGFGLADGESFEAQLEERLASRAGPGKVELLNFAFEGHSLTQQLATFERKVKPFAPDLVLVTLTPIEHRLAAEHLRRVLKEGAEIEYPYLDAVAREAGIRAGDGHATVVRRLRPHDEELTRRALRALHEHIHSAGFRGAVMTMRMPTQPAGRLAALAELAEDAGFPILDISDAYDSHDESQLRVAPWDRHPNVEANRLLALALERELRRYLLLPTPASGTD
jgi:hypothetical protein